MRIALVVLVIAVALLAIALWSDRSPEHSKARAAATREDAAVPAKGERGPDAAQKAAAHARPFGKVVDDRTDAPVAGAAVTACAFATGTVLSTASAADGTFAFPDAAGAGLVELVARHEGYGSTSIRCSTADDPIVVRLRPGGGLRGLVVTAEGRVAVSPCRVSALRCRQDDEPWHPHDALLRQTLPSNLILQASTSTDARGSFEMADLRPGPYALLVQADGFAPCALGWLRDEERVEVRPGAVADVEVALPRTEAFLVDVIDEETGTPLDDVSFELGLHVERWSTFAPATAVRDRDGAYELRAGYGEHRFESTWLRVNHAGYASRVLTFSGQNAGYRFRVALGKGGTVLGHVWSSGKPMAGALVVVEWEVAGLVIGSAVTGADGAFAIGPLEAGEKLAVHAYDQAHDPIAAISLVLGNGERRTLEIGAAGATAIEGFVAVGGKPVAGANVRVSGASDADVATGRGGRYRFEGLSAGRYEVEVFTDGSYFDRYVDLAAGRCLRLDIQASVAIPGVVIDADTGLPLTGIEALEVVASREAIPDSDAADVDREGRFQLHVEPGVFDLDLPESEEVYVVERPRVDVTAGTDSEPVTVRVVRNRKDGKIDLDIKDGATGETVLEGAYEYEFKRTTGAGSFEDGALTEEGLALGTHRFRIHTEAHAPTTVEVALTPARKVVRQTVTLRPADAVRITEVQRGGPAARAGLEVGDVILSCNGNPTTSIAALRAALKAARGGVSVEYERGGERKVVTLAANVLGVGIENVLLGR
ncbi:MAG TPA: carboxypeptidase regulatory-like domain-containing protein [Planctomycetota bacterium]|nr:carboxypeptidase regulatory-like domain-containing protein [Planctomycetota bacterium]